MLQVTKINIKLFLAAALFIGVLLGAIPAAPHASAAVAQKYVTACKQSLADKTCNNLKQAWIDSCDPVFNQPSKQNWWACIASKAKLQGSTDADKIDSNANTAGSIPGAADPALNFSNGTCTQNGCNLVKNYVNPFINKFLAPLAILAVIIGIIWGALDLTTSGGDPQRAASGKSHIQKALIGLVSFIFLYAMLNWLLPGGLI